jgi:hypothetical protein
MTYAVESPAFKSVITVTNSWTGLLRCVCTAKVDKWHFSAEENAEVQF